MNTFTSHQDDERLVWDLSILAIYLQKTGILNDNNGAEHWLEKQHWLPARVTSQELLDDQALAVKPQVLEHLLMQAKNKCQTVLFVQCFQDQQNYGLFANDTAGNCCWLWNKQSWNSHDLTEALQALVRYQGKDTWFFPHDSITNLFRKLWLHNKQQPLNTKQGQGLLGLSAYHTKLILHQKKSCPPHTPDNANHLDRLEAESIHIMREVMGIAENPAMLYSVGKDSSVMLHLARKAFYPSAPPFPLLHIDTRWKFQEMYQFRDYMAAEAGMVLQVHTNPEGIEQNISPLVHGSALHTDIMKTAALKQALDKYTFDITFGGARRDEEKSRAKERIFSFRNKVHRWDPKNQRPELWNLYNGHTHAGESIRVFPLSNWTELDIWQYIYRENIAIVPLYYAQVRPVIKRDNMLILIDDERLELMPQEQVQLKKIRFRTLGCYPLTGAIESEANTLEAIILELLQARTSERQGRAIDTDSTASMEKKKQEGYF